MTQDYITEFVAELRRRADDPVFGGSSEARVCAALAAELEERRAAWEEEELTYAEAAAISGYSDSQLRRAVQAGAISLRRRDLPRKLGHGVQRGPKRIAGPGQSFVDRLVESRQGSGRRRIG